MEQDKQERYNVDISSNSTPRSCADRRRDEQHPKKLNSVSCSADRRRDEQHPKKLNSGSCSADRRKDEQHPKKLNSVSYSLSSSAVQKK
ncbi:MAG: hypothetical protein P857_918 [Candidatus Xenolissoclinum pacificiensis L6]|uniref:Uncharacterized protein n=1 Tax=Candidatus Xenolissoclinum pacificiensis L6 TaxID=1401685 RepID=W2V0Y4_9RICK|nr:MAG: hypothetical protein P857_918 [Candidatus Xenolissoclinum pacificiensis L6]